MTVSIRQQKHLLLKSPEYILESKKSKFLLLNLQYAYTLGGNVSRCTSIVDSSPKVSLDKYDDCGFGFNL